jgi:hypothetical protein
MAPRNSYRPICVIRSMKSPVLAELSVIEFRQVPRGKVEKGEQQQQQQQQQQQTTSTLSTLRLKCNINIAEEHKCSLTLTHFLFI